MPGVLGRRCQGSWGAGVGSFPLGFQQLLPGRMGMAPAPAPGQEPPDRPPARSRASPNGPHLPPRLSLARGWRGPEGRARGATPPEEPRPQGHSQRAGRRPGAGLLASQGGPGKPQRCPRGAAARKRPVQGGICSAPRGVVGHQSGAGARCLASAAPLVINGPRPRRWDRRGRRGVYVPVFAKRASEIQRGRRLCSDPASASPTEHWGDFRATGHPVWFTESNRADPGGARTVGRRASGI